MIIIEFWIFIYTMYAISLLITTFIYFSLRKGIIMNLRHKLVKFLIKHLTPRIYKELNIYELFDEHNPYKKEVREIKNPRPMIKFIKENYDSKDLIGVEIGVQKGYNAKSIMSNLNMKKLYLIDIWKDDENFEFETLSRINSDKVISYRENSLIAYNHFKDNSLDFVYIDADHTYNGCLSDIENFYPKVKVNGIFGGHDYNLLYVERAVQDWIKKQNKSISLYVDICYNKVSIDWWFVKSE